MPGVDPPFFLGPSPRRRAGVVADGVGVGETFRVLKNNEKARYGEYRTARLVLAAWDAQEARPAAAQ